MSEPSTTQSSAANLASARPRVSDGADPATVIAAALTAIWILGALVFWVFVPGSGPTGGGWGGVGALVGLVAIVLPVALIWVAAISARSARIVRQESARLAAAVDAIRYAQAVQTQAQSSGVRPPVEAKLDEIARAQRQAEAALAELAQRGGPIGHGMTAPDAPPERLAPPPRASEAADDVQPALALEAPEDEAAEPISNADFIRALHFPEDERDTDGFHALRLALKDRFSVALVRSAQDMLTLLAEDGIYMDDLSPDRARPEVWRRFAQGERGRPIASLGGVRDRSCLVLTAGRMRQDPVFRDVAHHFLRKFDHTIAAFEPKASDADFVALAETRTARAFMLLGRVAGTFD